MDAEIEREVRYSKVYGEVDFDGNPVDVRVNGSGYQGVHVALYHDDRMFYDTQLRDGQVPEDDTALTSLCRRAMDKYAEETGIAYVGPLLDMEQ